MQRSGTGCTVHRAQGHAGTRETKSLCCFCHVVKTTFSTTKPDGDPASEKEEGKKEGKRPGLPFRTLARCREKRGPTARYKPHSLADRTCSHQTSPNYRPRASLGTRSISFILCRCALLGRQLLTVSKVYSRRVPSLNLAGLAPWRTAKGSPSHWGIFSSPRPQRAPPGSPRFRLGVNYDSTARGHPQCGEVAGGRQ